MSANGSSLTVSIGNAFSLALAGALSGLTRLPFFFRIPSFFPCLTFFFRVSGGGAGTVDITFSAMVRSENTSHVAGSERESAVHSRVRTYTNVATAHAAASSKRSGHRTRAPPLRPSKAKPPCVDSDFAILPNGGYFETQNLIIPLHKAHYGIRMIVLKSHRFRPQATSSPEMNKYKKSQG